MLCPICNTENGHLTVICTSCGSFVQSKVENLDLFATIWQLIESPKSAFHRIAIAQHKNYTLFLSAIMGIGLIFFLMRILKAGSGDIPLLNILIVGFLFGPVGGIVSLLILALVQKTIARLLRLQTRFKNVSAVIAYAAVPIIFSVVAVLPIEILTFGKYFFSSNPSPYVIKPISYALLLMLDGLCLVWALRLYFLGNKVLYDSGTVTTLFVSTMSIAVYAGLIWIVLWVISNHHIGFSIEKAMVAYLQRLRAENLTQWIG